MFLNIKLHYKLRSLYRILHSLSLSNTVDDFSNVVTKIESPEMTEAWLSFILQCLQVWSQNFSFFSTSV
jgi:hypothetical protein